MAKTSALAKAKAVLCRDAELPALPETLSEILQLTEDNTSAMSDLATVIERDPALTARILRVSNSPFYGMRQQVGTIKLALVILGVREVRNLVLSIKSVDAIRSWSTHTSLQDAYWEHAVYVGAFARSMSISLRLGYQGEAFAAGLLHDMGKALMVMRLGDQYAELLEHAGTSAPLCRAESNAFGFTHSDAGAVLAAGWNYPATLVDAIAMHHHSEDHSLSNAMNPQLAALVRLANRAAHVDPKILCQKSTMTAADMEAWEKLQETMACSQPDEREEILLRAASQLRDAPLLFI